MLRGTISGTAGGPPQQNIAEIIHLLESNNISVTEETTALVRDSLSSTSDPWLLNGLVDYYMTSGNVLVRRLLTGIRQPQHKNLLAKLDEHLQKPATRYVALNLFGHILRKDPLWIHRVVQSRAFTTVIKCLQLDNDVAALTVAMYVVSTLLPKVPTQIAPSLNHLFGIYVRLVSWKIVRGPDVNDLNMSNFDTALHSLFLCLYGMYPCSFLGYLQQYYCKTKGGDTKTSEALFNMPATTPGGEQVLMEKKRHEIFKSRVIPMLKQVRIHPNLVLYTKELEILNEKWRKMESHDIVAEISQLPVEGSFEKHQPSDDSTQKLTLSVPTQHVPESNSDSSLDKVTSSSMSQPQTEVTMIWSPSMEIGLSTPPPSRGISPTRDISEEKSYNMENSEKSKARPNTLTLSSSSLKGTNISTPCTPTLPSLSFEYDKGEMEPSFLSTDANCSIPTSSEKTRSTTVNIAASSQNEFTFPNNIPTSSTVSSITDFSPALRPSAEHLSAPKVVHTAPMSAKDSLFIGKEKPSVRDILESADVDRNLSSNELLEREIQFSIKTERQERNTDLDWLHFGQGPLNEKDSQSLLASYLQIRCALLYEQHRRQQLATKARRLMRKIYESSALEERNKALTEILTQKENDITQLQLMVKSLKSEFLKQEKNHQSLHDALKKESSQLSSDMRAIEEENIRLRFEKDEDAEALKNALHEERKTQSELYKCKLQLEAEARNKGTNQELRAQIVQLQKEMLVVEELSRKMESLHENEVKFKVAKAAEHEMLVESYKKESKRQTQELRKVGAACDFMESKAKEFEKIIERKNRLLEEQKKYLENVKSLARSQIQAMESKYQAQKSITMRMEVQIMELYADLAAAEEQSSDNIGQSRGKPIQPPSQSFQHRHGHLLEACPELSPPIKVSMLEETSVPTSELEASTTIEE